MKKVDRVEGIPEVRPKWPPVGKSPVKELVALPPILVPSLPWLSICPMKVLQQHTPYLQAQGSKVGSLVDPAGRASMLSHEID